MSKRRNRSKRTITYPPCPYCGARVELKDSEIVYARSYGDICICSRYPECDAYVGSRHGRPLGTLANPALRELRIECHRVFDPLWRGEDAPMSRSNAYAWLAKAMEGRIPKEKVHIGMFTEDQCRAVTQLSESLQFAGPSTMRRSDGSLDPVPSESDHPGG